MAEEESSHFSSPPDSIKRKYDDGSPPPPSGSDEIQLAKQKAQEIAARLMSGSFDTKRPRVDTNGFDAPHNSAFSSPPNEGKGTGNMAASNPPVSYGSSYTGGGSKKIEIPQGRVGVIIGKGGETIKYLQNQSGAKIQVTRDMDADPNASTRAVELMGTPDQITRAEQLINDVLIEADAGGSGTVSRRFDVQGGGGGGGGVEHFVMKIPSNKVGLVIGKGGETIKQMQAQTHARIQVIPLHLPPGDTTTERNVHIDGTSDQVEAAKQLINEVISSENRGRTSMGGGYSQQGYQMRPPSSWGAHGGPPMQQSGYGYMQQPGPYSGQSQYMSHPPYGGYPPQSTSGGYASGWDQSTGSASQPPSQGYDYYGQPPPSSQPQSAPGGSSAPPDNTYNYSQPPASGYSQPGQGYSQDGYGGYPQSGYGQQPSYDQQGYGSAPSYGSVPNTTQEGHTTSYGVQGEAAQAPPQLSGQQGYGTAQPPSSNATSYPPQGTQPGYGVPPTSQAGYGTQPAQPAYGSSYGPPQAQKTPTNPTVYGQSQQSPSTAPGGYGQPAPAQSGYPPHSQPPTSYGQSDSSAQPAPPSGYGPSAGQTGYGAAPAYGAAPGGQPGYGQGAAPYNGSYGSGY